MGLGIIFLISIAIIDPKRFQSAGVALSPFSKGFGELIQAPLEPIGKFGQELGEFGRGLGEFGKGFESFAGGIGTGLSGITSPFSRFFDWLEALSGGKGAWADLPQTQYLENTLMRSGYKK